MVIHIYTTQELAELLGKGTMIEKRQILVEGEGLTESHFCLEEPTNHVQSVTAESINLKNNFLEDILCPTIFDFICYIAFS